jgi:hypothetical protein
MFTSSRTVKEKEVVIWCTHTLKDRISVPNNNDRPNNAVCRTTKTENKYFMRGISK